MSARTARKRQRLAVQTAELAVAVPQVIAHRMARMSVAGLTPTERDRKELRRMGAEKTSTRVHDAALGVLSKGSGPVHRRALSNAKRLARTKHR